MSLTLRIVLFVAIILGTAAHAKSEQSNHQDIPWQAWSDAAFEQARKENKPVVLDLEAVWCHWCHVMDKQTYANPSVVKLLQNNFVALQVDQDARPDLSNRYQDYGWPATIFFSPSGAEIVKRAGYIPPDEMIALLKEVIKHPNKPDPSLQKKAIDYGSNTALNTDLRKKLRQECLAGYDTARGGMATDHKFLDWDTVEYWLAGARAGDKDCKHMAEVTLKGELNLIDPVWGGVYQYSTDGDWVHPHFEKIMQMQTENMRILALAYEGGEDRAALVGAKAIAQFLSTFMTSPDGAFYTSMDADLIPGKASSDYFSLSDADRRKKGIPRIDKHMYARENGWAINALVALYGATSEKSYLDQAIRAANWVIANRFLPDGGYRHDATDAAGPFLDDTLAMARAFLSLYGVTGDRHWLTRAEEATTFIDNNFRYVLPDGKIVGYASSSMKKHTIPSPEPLVDENVMLVRLANLLNYYSGKKSYREMAEIGMRYLATPEIASGQGMYTAGILLADRELSAPPVHITVVGRKDDPDAKSLLLAALKYPSGYKMTEWWDRTEGPLPNMDIEFPDLKKAAVFGCANQRCSAPVYEPQGIAELLDGLSASKE
jgi:uncharacterized protein YyaL (SSP411 family)